MSKSKIDAEKNDYDEYHGEKFTTSGGHTLGIPHHKKSTAVIDKQNLHQESISKSIHEINRVISENTNLNKDIKEEIKIMTFNS